MRSVLNSVLRNAQMMSDDICEIESIIDLLNKKNRQLIALWPSFSLFSIYLQTNGSKYDSRCYMQTWYRFALLI